MKKTEQETLKQLFEIARSLSSTLDIDTLLKRIGEAAEQLTEAEASSIMLVDDDKENLFFKVATGEKSNILKKLRVKIGQGIAGTVAQTKESLVVDDVSKDSRFSGSFDKSSGFVTKSILAVPILLGNEIVGVAEVLNKKNGQSFTEDDKIILQSLASFASVSIVNARFAEDQKNFFVYIIEIVIQGIESRNAKLTGHTAKVAQISTAIARHMDLNQQDYKDIYYAALLHDIGYLSTTKSTFIETHPNMGWEMIRKINILKGAAPIILSHHEMFDGSGYPKGLIGEAIPIGARIISLAEYVEDMHAEGHSYDKIALMIQSNSSKFDPKAAEIYLSEIAPLQRTEVTA
ncbi:MAG: hypothetical protein A2252_08905 [Elusimicrobia bacterium RIFOXYA2_FULL_39_19]|nr:MAG: hypothetical protein A2252_08905 [Elusimicrobia bacterium RIFOXYA2_FULL_39_19]